MDHFLKLHEKERKSVESFSVVVLQFSEPCSWQTSRLEPFNSPFGDRWQCYDRLRRHYVGVAQKAPSSA
jgi:hypothetical protein